MRTLASIQIVGSAEPIPGADAIERLRVLGWWVVAKKGEFRPGEPVVYVEIDSLLPEWPAFEFLRKSSWRPPVSEADGGPRRGGFRIRTVRLRGQVSQGICFPLSILPAGAPSQVGADVTDALDIVKYEPPIPLGLAGRVKGAFPGFLSKTDETRIQVAEPVLERYRGERFAVTEKLDGTSFSAFLRDGEYGLCSRNLLLDETDTSNAVVRLADGLDLRARLTAIRERYGFDPAIQGEVIGPGIQGNRYGRPSIELHVFNVIDLGTGDLVPRTVMREALALAGLTAVPELAPLVLEHTIDELVALADGDSVLKPGVPREGLVLRPELTRQDPDLRGRLSFKVINPAFLLKYGE